MKERQMHSGKMNILFVSAFDLFTDNLVASKVAATTIANKTPYSSLVSDIRCDKIEVDRPAISYLKFPFDLKRDQIHAVNAWFANHHRGSIIYGTGTGKTEIAFECARKIAEHSGRKRFCILLLVPRIYL